MKEKNRYRYKIENGFTLVELLVVLAIVVVVLSIGYRLLFFGQDTFSKGEDRYSVQESAQLASDLITRELRFANKVIILPDIPSRFDTDKRYFYLDDSGVLKHYLGHGNTVDAVGSLNIGIQFTDLNFKKTKDDVLAFSLATASDFSDFSTDSAVQILNLLKGDKIDDVRLTDKDAGGPVICYYYSDNEKRITRFAFRIDENPGLPKTVEGYFTGEFDIVCYVQSGTDVKKLIPHIEHTGEKIIGNGIEQIPRVTAYNFTNPLVFTVVAKDGSTVDYNVEVKEIIGQPSATNVGIKTNSKDNNFIPSEDALLEGMYTYVSNNPSNPDNEGDSLYQWQYSESEDFSNPKVFATSIDVVPQGLVGKYVRFGVMPVTKDKIPANQYIYGNIIKIYPPIDTSTFWGSMINDIYAMSLPDYLVPDDFVSSVLYRTRYSVGGILDSDLTEYSLTMTYDHDVYGVEQGGSLLFKDVAGYADNLDSYKITIDAEARPDSGFGVLLYGTLRNNGSDRNIDSGYMFQFNPGWNGFYIRKVENGQVNPWFITHGVLKNHHSIDGLNDQNIHQRHGIYTPQEIRNSNFRWQYDNTELDKQKIIQWRRRYNIEITTQRQLDNSITLRVVLIDESGNRSNEMWFGNFPEFNMELYNSFGISNNSYQLFKPRPLSDSAASAGTMIGLRTWDAEYKNSRPIFRNITIEQGFSLDIESARFVDNRTIYVKFSEPVMDTVDKYRIRVKDHTVSDAYISNIYGEQVLVINLQGNVSNNILNNGLEKSLIIERGGVRHYMAGDVEIKDQDGFDISAR